MIWQLLKVFKGIRLIGLILCICTLLPEAWAGPTNSVVFNFTDFGSQAQGTRKLELYPLGAPFTNGAGVIVTRDRKVGTTGTNGSVTITNVYAGQYRGEFQGTFGTSTNWFNFPDTNGTINASDWVTAPTNGSPGILAYSTSQADARFLNRSNAPIFVSAVGITNGLSSISNGGDPFGPDTPGTTTSGINEAINAAYQTNGYGVISGGGWVSLRRGMYFCTGQISIPNDYPFSFRWEGVGKSGSAVIYSGSGSNDFVVTSRSSAGGHDASLNLAINGVGFYYVRDTNKVSIMRLSYVNELHMEDCLFASYQTLQRLGAGLVYRSTVPTNRLGIVGLRVEGGANNKMDFYHCGWVGLGVGAWMETDHSSFNDCFFGCIGTWSTNGNEGATSYNGSLWKTGDSNRGFLLTNGPAIFSDTGLFEMNVNQCQFFTLRCAMIPNGSGIACRNPLFEDVLYTSLTDAAVDVDVGRLTYDGALGTDRQVQSDGTVSGTNGATSFLLGVPDGGHGDFLKVYYKDLQYLKLSPTNFYAKGIFTGDGSGLTNLSGGGPWKTNNSNIYFERTTQFANDHNSVGIGTNIPHAVLEVSSQAATGDGVPSTLLLSTIDEDTTVGLTLHDTSVTNNWNFYLSGDSFKLGKQSVEDFWTINPSGNATIAHDLTVNHNLQVNNDLYIPELATSPLSFRVMGIGSFGIASWFSDEDTSAGSGSYLLGADGHWHAPSTGANFLTNATTANATFYANVAAASITDSGLTASRVVLTDGSKNLASAAASGAVSINADGSATTFAQVNALAPGAVLTNGHSLAVVFSNTVALDAAHNLWASNNAFVLGALIVGTNNTSGSNGFAVASPSKTLLFGVATNDNKITSYVPHTFKDVTTNESTLYFGSSGLKSSGSFPESITPITGGLQFTRGQLCIGASSATGLCFGSGYGVFWQTSSSTPDLGAGNTASIIGGGNQIKTTVASIQRALIAGAETTLTESTATAVLTCSLANSKYAGFEIFAVTHADDGTDFQSRTDNLRVSAVNKGGTVTLTVSGTVAGTPDPSDTAVAVSAGTLTTAWTATASGTTISIKNNAVSSLTQTTLKCKWDVKLSTDDTSLSISPQ